MDIRAAFRSADRDDIEYRAAPFWAWNDELEGRELRRQIRAMRRAGLGGHFMHARVGLGTPYLGEQYARCIQEAVQESKAAGLKAWLYDEDCWPSGTGGGAIPAAGLEFQQKILHLETRTPRGFAPGSNTLAVFLGVPGRGGFSELRRVAPAEAARAASARETLLHFYYAAVTGYTDVLSAAAVRRFIQSTHEKYRGWVGREFGRTIPGIFTDEPQLRPYPWTFALPAYFQKTRGGDLLDLLPSLFLRYGDYRKVRWQYFTAVSELFVESYTRQISEWCRRNHLALTGHMDGEESLASQVLCGGAAMPHYEWMHVPGMDHLKRQVGDPVPCKQSSSVAHQLGRPRVLSEMFGGAGWGASLEELKWLAEWQFALGVNRVCQHLSLYSLRGCRKRDFPPSLHLQQPWWDDYRLLNDLVARELFLLTRGSPLADVLVIHPIESGYALFDRDRTRELNELSEAFTQLSQRLVEIQRDFDYGDESLLARHGRVSGQSLRVGSASYRAVMLPPMVTIRASTLRLVSRLLKNGGCVIRTGRLPLRVDGEPSKAAMRALSKARKTRLSAEALRNTLNSCLPARLELRPARGSSARSVCVHQRDCGELQIFFLANTSPKDAVRATFRAWGRGSLELWDAETGEIEPLPSRLSGDCTVAPVELPPMGSRLIVLDKRRAKLRAPARPRRLFQRLELAPSWTLRRLDANALTLDQCRWRVDGGQWRGPLPILDLQDHLAQVDRAMNLELLFSVRSELPDRPGRQLSLALEQPGEHSIAINGHNLRLIDAGAWIDQAIRLVKIDGWLARGENEILLRRRFSGNPELYHRMQDPAIHPAEKERLHHRVELESIYLVGDFAVRSAGAFSPGPRGTVHTDGPFALAEESYSGDGTRLTEDGLPFYAGRVELRQSVELSIELLRRAASAVLELEPPNAIVTAVSVNGQSAGKRAWRPYRFELGGLLKEGANEITLILTSSLRNLFGPHHHVDGDPVGVGPGSFKRTRTWVDSPDTPKSIWRDGYSFVRFGLAGPAKLVFYD